MKNLKVFRKCAIGSCRVFSHWLQPEFLKVSPASFMQAAAFIPLIMNYIGEKIYINVHHFTYLHFLAKSDQLRWWKFLLILHVNIRHVRLTKFMFSVLNIVLGPFSRNLVTIMILRLRVLDCSRHLTYKVHISFKFIKTSDFICKAPWIYIEDIGYWESNYIKTNLAFERVLSKKYFIKYSSDTN